VMEGIERDAPHQPRRAVAEPVGHDRVAELMEDQSDEQRDDEGDEKDEDRLETILSDYELENDTPYLRGRLPLSIATRRERPSPPAPRPPERARGVSLNHVFQRVPWCRLTDREAVARGHSGLPFPVTTGEGPGMRAVHFSCLDCQKRALLRWSGGRLHPKAPLRA
jgi:hypothetical protein